MVEQFLNLIVPFFSTPKTYSEMLAKLAGAAFYVTYGITFFLREIPALGALFRKIDQVTPGSAIISRVPQAQAFNRAGALIAISAALLSQVLHLHDRVSDILGIRRRFDRNRILIPLARLVGANLSPDQKAKIAIERHRLMRSVFYRYASSRIDDPVVDKHDIEHALGAWSWFWTFVEGGTLTAIGTIIALLYSSHSTAIYLASATLTFIAMAVLISQRLAHYAQNEIETIAATQGAREAVRAVFDAL
ncbi:MAG: hypothetical protein JSR99_08220 [Proteobacteria bacterium]|nr:hypothetical protein [Pseudomonadota bacterium]